MFNRLKLGTKISGGFIVIMLIMACVAYVGWDNLQVVADRFFKVNELESINKSVLQARRHEKNFIIRGDKQWADEVSKEISKLRNTANDLKARLKDPANIRQMETVLSAADSYEKTFASMVRFLAEPDIPIKEREEKMKAFDGQLRDSGRAVEKECMDAINNHINRLRSQIAWANGLIIGGTGTALGLGLIFAFFITRMITKPINRAIDGLNTGADQVAAASMEVANSSQSLAEGASEQAAAIQETSASLEELSSMTRKNADHSTQTRAMMAEAMNIVEKASSELNHMISSVADVTQTSEQIGKIIKTIDEIAFQTNLLALNAAVEAARAGEAGAGFSVVAAEVRNLAVRAAEAAKSTSTLIENSIKSVRRSSEFTQSTQDAFAANKDISMKISLLIDEIEAASKEQAQGIEQINKAVVEMDKVVQRNAASAEEAASASEELNAQATETKAYVRNLMAVIHGYKGNGLDGKAQTSANGTTSMDSQYGQTARKKKRSDNKKPLLPARPVAAGDEDFRDF
jgi:methyl-accepting chemotaxis protein